MRKASIGALLGILVTATALLSLGCPKPNDPAPSTDFVSFKIDGTTVSLKAGPSGTTSGPGGDVTFGGIPAAFVYGSDTKILASPTSAAYSSTFESDAGGRILLLIPGTAAVGATTLDGTSGSLTYDYVLSVPKQTYSDATYTFSITLTVSKNEGVGGYLEGSFSGQLTTDTTDTYAITEGSFSVRIFAEVTKLS